jgi:hypothetical protein
LSRALFGFGNLFCLWVLIGAIICRVIMRVRLLITMACLVAPLGCHQEQTLVDTSAVPQPPKPYDVAVYDVYSALIPNIEESWVNRIIERSSEEILIRAETLTFQDSGLDRVVQPPTEAALVSDKRFKWAVDAAVADYLKRNNSMLELQRKFSLPHYDLFTQAEERSIFKGAAACLAFQQKHPGYERSIELSAVGFSQDQTVALVSFVETRATRDFCIGGTFKSGQGRMLQNRGGKWYLLTEPRFSDWIE